MRWWWSLIALWIGPAVLVIVGWITWRGITRSSHEEWADREEEAAFWARQRQRMPGERWKIFHKDGD